MHHRQDLRPERARRKACPRRARSGGTLPLVRAFVVTTGRRRLAAWMLGSCLPIATPLAWAATGADRDGPAHEVAQGSSGAAERRKVTELLVAIEESTTLLEEILSTFEGAESASRVLGAEAIGRARERSGKGGGGPQADEGAAPAPSQIARQAEALGKTCKELRAALGGAREQLDKLGLPRDGGRAGGGSEASGEPATSLRARQGALDPLTARLSRLEQLAQRGEDLAQAIRWVTTTGRHRVLGPLLEAQLGRVERTIAMLSRELPARDLRRQLDQSRRRLGELVDPTRPWPEPVEGRLELLECERSLDQWRATLDRLQAIEENPAIRPRAPHHEASDLSWKVIRDRWPGIEAALGHRLKTELLRPTDPNSARETRERQQRAADEIAKLRGLVDRLQRADHRRKRMLEPLLTLAGLERDVASQERHRGEDLPGGTDAEALRRPWTDVPWGLRNQAREATEALSTGDYRPWRLAMETWFLDEVIEPIWKEAGAEPLVPVDPTRSLEGLQQEMNDLLQVIAPLFWQRIAQDVEDRLVRRGAAPTRSPAKQAEGRPRNARTARLRESLLRKLNADQPAAEQAQARPHTPREARRKDPVQPFQDASKQLLQALGEHTSERSTSPDRRTLLARWKETLSHLSESMRRALSDYRRGPIPVPVLKEMARYARRRAAQETREVPLHVWRMMTRATLRPRIN